MSLRKTLELVTGIATITIAMTAPAWAQSSITSRMSENERNRAYAREQFTKNFRDIQLNGQKLLKDHKNRALTPRDLGKQAREINKNAKKLRSLMALGDLAEKVEIEKGLDTPDEFDKSIRRLATLIWDFAHNPIHKNSKVFNTDLAARAQTDLLTIIDLSKILSDVARDYVQNGSIVE